MKEFCSVFGVVTIDANECVVLCECVASSILNHNRQNSHKGFPQERSSEGQIKYN